MFYSYEHDLVLCAIFRRLSVTSQTGEFLPMIVDSLETELYDAYHVLTGAREREGERDRVE